MQQVSEPARIELSGTQAFCVGSWTLAGLAGLEQRLSELDAPSQDLVLDGSRLQALDTSGALRLLQWVQRLEHAGCTVQYVDWRASDQALLHLVQQRWQAWDDHPHPPPQAALSLIAQIGQHAVEQLRRALGFITFTGEVAVTLGRLLINPRQIRWRPLLAVLETAGAHALPIVGLLSFLMGLVIAYQGGVQLRNYGANIFVVELVALTMLRELAPLLTAIIVAGRTGSAFTAQIGTMRVTEEVDALATIGISPMALLVVPKLLGLMIALPLLALFADIAGIIGGMVMAALMLGVAFPDFLDRLPMAVDLTSLLIGLGKAPVFAAIIALVGCYQGFQVSGSAESVGHHTTLSVVQAIFLVIVVNAVFSVALSILGI